MVMMHLCLYVELKENINEGSREIEDADRKYPDGEACLFEKLLREQVFPGY